MAKLTSHLQALEKARTALKVYQTRVADRTRRTTQSHIDATATVLSVVETQRTALKAELEPKGVEVSFSGANPLVQAKPNVRAWDLANQSARTIEQGNALAPIDELKTDAIADMDLTTYKAHAEQQKAEVNSAIQDLQMVITTINSQLPSKENPNPSVTESGTFGRKSEAYEVLTGVRDELQAEINEYQKQLVEIDKEVNFRSRLLEKSDAKITKLQGELKNSQEEAALYKQQKDDVILEQQKKQQTEADLYKEEKNNLVEQVATLEQQNKNLVQQMSLERNDYQGNMLNLSRELKEAQKTADVYKEKAEAYEKLDAVAIQKENTELKQSLQSEKAQHAALKENYAELEVKYNSALQTIKSMYATFVNAVKSVFKSDSQVDAAIKEKVQKQLPDTVTALNAQNTKMQSYQEQIDTLTVQNQALSAGLDKALGKQGPKMETQAEAEKQETQKQSLWQKLTK